MPTAEYADLFDIDSDANGDPILVDPVSGDTMATWDRSEGAWIPATIGTAADPVPGTSHFVNTEHESVSTDILNTDWVVDAEDHDDLQAALDHAETENISWVIPAPNKIYPATSTLEIPEGVTVFTPANADGGNQAEISGSAGVDPVVSVKGDEAGGASLIGVRVSSDGTEDAFNGDLLNGLISRCTMLGDVVITSDGTAGSIGGQFLQNNMRENNITADTGVSPTFLIDQNVRVKTVTSNDATEGTNT